MGLDNDINKEEMNYFAQGVHLLKENPLIAELLYKVAYDWERDPKPKIELNDSDFSTKNAKIYLLFKEIFDKTQNNLCTQIETEIKKRTGYSNDNIPPPAKHKSVYIGEVEFDVLNSPSTSKSYKSAFKEIEKTIDEYILNIEKSTKKKEKKKIIVETVKTVVEMYNKTIEKYTKDICRQTINTKKTVSYITK